MSDARVLWVDDRPANNEYERRALEALGLRVDISTSTEDALARQKARRLDTLRSSGDKTPYVIYATSREPEHIDESRRHGALGCTNEPQELLDYVRQGLGA